MRGIRIEFSEAATAPPGWHVYRLAHAQFDRYRPPTHEYLHLDAMPSSPSWASISPRRESVPGRTDGRAILPTLTRPHPGRLADLDHWYNTHHLPEVLAVPGFAAGRRYVSTAPAGTVEHVRLALYELVDDDLQAALRRLQEALPTMVHTDALDSGAIASWLYVPLETR